MTTDGLSDSPRPKDHDCSDLAELDRSDWASRRWYRRRGAFVVCGLLLFIIWFVPFVPSLLRSTITVTRLDAKGKPIEVEVGPGTKQWISIKKVSRHMVNAVVVSEDAKFYQHYGFDFESIAKAIELNRKKGRYVRGASTISQQVVKIAFLSREKTIVRKIREAAGTVILEMLLPKEKILEWYINLCEFGGGIYGVKPAGLYYFQTRPELLTIEQAVNLAVVIPSPNKWSRGLRSKSLTPFGQRRFARIVNNMLLAGYITDVQRDIALARGNFGNPIFGINTIEEEDDCRGDRECEDGASESRDQPDSPSEVPNSDKALTPNVITSGANAPLGPASNTPHVEEKKPASQPQVESSDNGPSEGDLGGVDSDDEPTLMEEGEP